MFVAAFQESDQKLDAAATKAAIISFGHGAATVDDLDTFIDHYDPATRTVTPPLTAAASHE